MFVNMKSDKNVFWLNCQYTLKTICICLSHFIKINWAVVNMSNTAVEFRTQQIVCSHLTPLLVASTVTPTISLSALPTSGIISEVLIWYRSDLIWLIDLNRGSSSNRLIFLMIISALPAAFLTVSLSPVWTIYHRSPHHLVHSETDPWTTILVDSPLSIFSFILVLILTPTQLFFSPPPTPLPVALLFLTD